MPAGPAARTRARTEPGSCYFILGKNYKDAVTCDGCALSEQPHDSAQYGLHGTSHDQVSIEKDFSDLSVSAKPTATDPMSEDDESYGPSTVQGLIDEDDEDYYSASGSEDLDDAGEIGAAEPSSDLPSDPSPSSEGGPDSLLGPGRHAADSLLVAEIARLRATEDQLRSEVARLRPFEAAMGKSRRSKASLPGQRVQPLTAACSTPVKPSDMARMMNKPPTYDGSPTSDLRLWLTIMASYLTAQCLGYPFAVQLAVTYLVKDASKFWFTHSGELKRKGADIHNWRVFKRALFERFGCKNAEDAARDRLATLEQGSKSYAQYVNAFADCYAHIPKFDEADKIHRFLRGLRPSLCEKLCINPRTSKRWARYQAMVTYGYTLMHETAAHAGLIKDIAAAGYTGKRPTTGQSDRQQPSKKPRSQGHADSAAGTSGTGLTDDIKPAEWADSTKAQKTFYVVRGDATIGFTREKAVANFCQNRHYCAHCYQKGHTPNYCRNGKAAGYPPQFDPNYRPKPRADGRK